MRCRTEYRGKHEINIQQSTSHINLARVIQYPSYFKHAITVNDLNKVTEKYMSKFTHKSVELLLHMQYLLFDRRTMYVFFHIVESISLSFQENLKKDLKTWKQ